jgi:hypothetical protein
LPRGWTQRQFDRALDALGHVAVTVIADTEGDVLIVATSDPDGELRRLRVNAKHGLAIEAMVWVGEGAGKTLAEAARGRLVKSGRQMKGRWVACRPDTATAAVLQEAEDRFMWIYTDDDRRRLALERGEREFKRMERG